MITRRILMRGAGGLIAPLLAAQNSTGRAKTVFKHDLPDLTLKGWSCTAVEVSYGPGEASAAHRHPGITIAYVLEGEIRSKVGDGPEQTYSAGQMLWRRRISFTRFRATPAPRGLQNCWRSCWRRTDRRSPHRRASNPGFDESCFRPPCPPRP